MDPQLFLSARDVTFRYFEQSKRNVLDHASLEIAPGRVTVITGNSGCGKSTFAAVAAGLYPENAGILESGEIAFRGRPLKGMSFRERTKYLSLMFQNPDLQFCMDTLRREMRFCMENICVPQPEMDSRIALWSERLGIGSLLDQPLHTLSGGEKQKAALACLFLLGSEGVLLDEPFANIDRESAREIIAMLGRANREDGLTVIAIDHQLDDWLPILDEVIVLGEGGKVLRRGITRENLPQQYQLFVDQGITFPKKRRRKRPEVPENEAAIRLEGFSVQRGASRKRKARGTEPDFLLEGVSASFPRGQITAILGPSGIGKTTLFLALLGQIPYGGDIFLCGEGQDRELRRIRQKDLFREIGIVFQNPGNQFISQNVLEEVEKSIRQWEPQASPESVKERALAQLDTYGLRPFQRYSPYMLSQGQQRRLAVLAVLTGGQKILLLDEPTYGQDYRSSEAILEQLSRKADEEGLTVLLTTHDRKLAGSYADKIYEVKGRALVQASPQAILDQEGAGLYD